MGAFTVLWICLSMVLLFGIFLIGVIVLIGGKASVKSVAAASFLSVLHHTSELGSLKSRRNGAQMRNEDS